MKKTGKLTPLKQSQDDLMNTLDVGTMEQNFGSSLQTMRRSLAEPPVQFPKTVVQNASLPTGGITTSKEHNPAEGLAELEVLKAILNREGYINRVAKSAKTINKKFKPEIADILDLIRAASLDVIESIVKWREAKKDHDAAFLWNQMNYMLKMPSDLDFLSKYLAIERYIGFGLIRNPFVIPSPLEDGVLMYKDLVITPGNIEKGTSGVDGFNIIGGISQHRLNTTYEPSEKTLRSAGTMERSTDPVLKPSPYGRQTQKSKEDLEKEATQSLAKSTSFVMNADMKKIRMAELVILKEEDKFGRWSRDPENRLAPYLQANTRLAAVELRKDDRRAVEQPSATTGAHAPHAQNSDIGLVDDAWLPQAQLQDNYSKSKFLDKVDEEVIAVRRGEGKFGGQLAPLTTKGVDTRIRKPLRTSVGSEIEFGRYRRKRVLGERLAEIEKLKAEIASQKASLDELKVRNTVRRREACRVGTSTRMSTAGAGANVPGSGSSSRSPTREGMRSKGSVGFSGLDENSQSLASGGGLSVSSSMPILPPVKMGMVGEGSTLDVALGVKNDDDLNNFAGITPSHSISGLSPRRQGNNGDNEYKANSPSTAVGEEESFVDKTSALENILADEEKLSETQNRFANEDYALNQEEQKILLALNHIEHDDDRMLGLKGVERKQDGAERSREIERKRRLLTKEEGKRRGPPPIESKNAYDWYATKCQSIIRGWLARCYRRWYRVASYKACMAIQATMRGKLGRIKVAKYRKEYFACTQITKIYRGYKARGTSAKMAANKNVGKSAIICQRIWRGHMGRCRALSKRALDDAASVARDSVDPRALLTSDVQELGLRIQYAVEEPETSTFPPDEVLHLIRLTIVILQQSRGVMGMSEYNFINARYYGEVEGETLTWAQASGMLNRAERLVRLIRAMAYGPGEKPPRMIQISPQAQILYASQLANPKWKLETFEQMGMGSKFCAQLFLWIISVSEVATRQKEFDNFLTSSFPDWLPQLYEIQASQRYAEYRVENSTRCVENLKEFELRNSTDPEMVKLLQEKTVEIKKEIDIAEEENKVFIVKEGALADSQLGREEYAVIAMEARVRELHEEAAEISTEYELTNKLANTGNTKAKEDLHDIRSKLTVANLALKALDAQFSLLVKQVDQNKMQRLDPNPLPVEIKVKSAAVGEARALEYLCEAKMKMYLLSQSVRHEEDLEKDSTYFYLGLKDEKREAHSEMWKLHIDAEGARLGLDKELNAALLENQKKEVASKDRVKPSDEELEEERREDDEQAKKERLKKLQFIPDRVLFHEHPSRPRPCVLALGRDLPQHCKTRMIEQVTKMMPGLFVFLDSNSPMGLDVREMQACLDANKCVIMMVDHGLTRTSRLNFTKSFSVTVRALIPNPFVIMCVGDDKNCRTTANSHFGCAKEDITRLHDCDIKVALEGMAWAIREILHPDIQAVMTERSSWVEPPSQAFVNVAEALFCLQSHNENIRSPEESLTAMSWRFTQRLLADPVKMTNRMKDIRRGQSDLRFVQKLAEYTHGQHWPAPMSTARQSDPLMHIMALFVELFIVAERKTLERGGMPVQALNRNSMGGIQGVEIVKDSEDVDDLVASENSGGWRMTAAKLVRVALQDLRTMKCTMKIHGKLYNVSAYKEENQVYFDCYDPKSSEVHVCMINHTDIPFLLMPNAQMLEDGGRPAAPQNTLELYQFLAKLLKMDPMVKSRADSRKYLHIKRDYTFLCQFKAKLGGHPVFIKCHEAALGQLYFSAYMQSNGAFLEFLLEERVRLDLLSNADPELEFKHVEHNDARNLLSLAMDRLKVSPSNTMVQCARGAETEGGKIFDSNAYRKKAGLLADVKAQGYKIIVRSRKGPGRIIVRRAMSVTGVHHLLEVRLATMDKVLICRLYEPRTRRVMEYRIKPYQRDILLGTMSDDHLVWIDKLMKRLRVNWRGEHSLELDTTISRKVRKVDGKRMLIKVAVESENSVKVQVIDNEISRNFEGILTSEQVIKILLYEQIGDTIKKDFGVDVSKPAVRKVLNEMARGPTLNPGEERQRDKDEETAASGKGAVDPKIFEISLMTVLADPDRVHYLTKQLELVVHRIRKESETFGYCIRNPVKVEFLSPSIPTNLPDMDTSLRFSPRLKQSERGGDLQAVIRCRKQDTYGSMEEALNQLALELALEAMAVQEADRKAAEEFERKLLGLDVEHEKEQELKKERAALRREREMAKEEEEAEEEEKKHQAAIQNGEEELYLKKKEAKEEANEAIEAAGVRPGSSPFPSAAEKIKRIKKAVTTTGEEGESATENKDSDKDKDSTLSHKRPDSSISNVSAPANLPTAEMDVKFDLDGIIEEATLQTAGDLVSSIEETHQKRAIERAQPGNTQEVRRLAILSADGKSMVEVDENKFTEEQRAILGRGGKKVFEGGSKTTFRDTRAQWHGHVAITVYEQLCWMGEDGVGKRLKWDVYEPGSAATYTGFINNLAHLSKILGKHGLDLVEPAKLTEMILFVAKFRMNVVDNKISWDGHPTDKEAPAYRIEFDTVRLYDENKITPINVSGDNGDEDANQDKLFEAEKARGKKISRLVRRVNGMLMQLITFEIKTDPEDLLAIADSKINSAAGMEEETPVENIEGNSSLLSSMGKTSADADIEKGAAEKRSETKLKKFAPPTLKIIGYDPRSKRKCFYIAKPAAILEVAGGIYSPYLDPSRRKELAKIASEALSLNFPKGKPFELVMQWSGASKEFAAASVAKVPTKGNTFRSGAETILKRTGKLFRTAMVLGRVETIVTLYSQNKPLALAEGEKDQSGVSGYVEKQLVVNVYTRAASEAAEMVVSDKEQVERIGRTIASFSEGEMRGAAVRRFMRFMHCDLIDDLEAEHGKRMVHLVLRPPNKDFLTEYMASKPTPPGEDIRPTGIPAVFLPLDTCGEFLFRCSMQLGNYAKDDEQKDYIITVYAKSETEGPERGLVIKIYERDTSSTAILHLGPKEIIRICDSHNEFDLMRDIVKARQAVKNEKLDEIETRFKQLTKKGTLEVESANLTNVMIKHVLDDLALTQGPDDSLMPYLKSLGRSRILNA